LAENLTNFVFIKLNVKPSLYVLLSLPLGMVGHIFMSHVCLFITRHLGARTPMSHLTQETNPSNFEGEFLCIVHILPQTSADPQIRTSVMEILGDILLGDEPSFATRECNTV
jgi:hypothetical protein